MAKRTSNNRSTKNDEKSTPTIDLDGEDITAANDGAGPAADTAVDDDVSSLGDEFESGHQSGQQSAVSEQENTKVPEPSGNTANSDDPGATANSDGGRPTVNELLDVPKTKVTGGKGTGGRPFVICETNGEVVVREPRADDSDRPQCPNCSTDAAAVLCGARNTKSDSIGATTYYYCPIGHCTFSTQVLKSVVAANILKRHRSGGKAPSPKPHITRPM